MSHAQTASPWRQPKQVWAVAFAAVVAFMGIGLVDPILPKIAGSLGATPFETELLFTSYLLVTAIAMLFTSFISSRIGAKKTLLIGLAIIVVFAAACALSGSVDMIIAFRGGWGLGNALFRGCTHIRRHIGARDDGYLRRNLSKKRIAEIVIGVSVRIDDGVEFAAGLSLNLLP